MRNPFSFFHKSKGLSDTTVHQYNNQPHYTNAPPPAQQSLVPAGYPTGGTGGNRYNDYPPALQPISAYPYASQPEKEAEAEAEAEWEINVGNNKNKKGQQKGGHIKAGNTINGGNMPIKLPQNGRFVFNAGGNTNDGDNQESGNIEFANVHA